MLDEEIRRAVGHRGAASTSAAEVIQRVFAHDVYHCAELNETLGIADLRQINLWE